jgi:ATP-dependent Clp protease ATP-binding subunit ClpX
MAGIKLPAHNDDPDARLRLRIFSFLAFRTLGHPMPQPVNEISEIATVVMDRQLPPGEALLRARDTIGRLCAEEVLVASSCEGDQSFTKVALPPRAIEYASGGRRSLGFLTLQKLVAGVPLDDLVNRAPPQAKPPRNTDRSDPKDFVTGLLRDFPTLTPRHLYEELGRRGYVGQEEARRSLSLAAYRHVVRLKRIYVDGAESSELARDNILLRGPTGSGKSLMAHLLFSDILKLPSIAADMTTFSETGYIGEDLTGILTRAVLTYGAPVAEIAVIVLDEIDKIADSGMGGGRTMVSRHGVQRGLLKLLEPGIVEVPTELGTHPYRCKRVPIRTGNLLWIGCGAFSGLDRSGSHRPPMGFVTPKTGLPPQRRSAGASDMAIYGILPELYGRFSIETELAPLSRDQQRLILAQNVITRYSRELASAGIALVVEAGAIDLLLDRADDRGTGARGLQAEMVAALQDAAFDAYSTTGDGRVIRVYTEGDVLRWEIDKRSSTAAKVTFADIAAMTGAPVAADAIGA